jgi:hypothetical protein
MDETQITTQDFAFDGGGLYEPMTVAAPSEEEATAIYFEKRKELPPKTVNITCGVCGAVTGQIDFPANHPIDTAKTATEHELVESSFCDEHSPTRDV